MIEKISATNLKGRTFSYDLERINVIVGENAEGKSAIIDTVLLAKLQYHPRIGKRNEDIFQLASGDRMTITEQVTGQLPRDITWYRDGDKVKFSGEKVLDTPPIMLDSKLYFELSPAKRIELVASLVDMAETANPAQIIAQVKNIKLETNSEHSEGIVSKLCNFLSGVQEINILRWLEFTLTQLREHLKNVNATRKRMTAVVTGIEHLRSLQDQNVTLTQGVESKLIAARLSLSILQTELGRLTGSKTEMERRNNRRTYLVGVNQLPVDKQLISNITAAKSEVGRYEKIVTTRKMSATEVLTAVTTTETNSLNLESRSGELDIEFKRVLKRLKDLLSLNQCPTCKAKGKGWQKSFKAEEEKRIVAMEKERLEKREEVNRLQATLSTLQRTLSRYTDEESELSEAKERFAALQNQEAKRMESGEAYRAAQTELQAMGAAEDIIAIKQQIDTVQITINDKQQAIVGLDSQHRELIAQRSQTANQIQASIEAGKLEAECEVLKAAGALLKEKQSELVEKAFDTLLETVNRFTKTIIPLPILYSNGELGYQNESQWVSSAVFSGSETAALFMGLSIALAARAPFKLAMFDEFTVFIGAQKERMIKQLIKLIDDKVLDQVILCDGPETIYSVLEKTRDDFQIIKVK
jgi:hypothetical protein